MDNGHGKVNLLNVLCFKTFAYFQLYSLYTMVLTTAKASVFANQVLSFREWNFPQILFFRSSTYLTLMETASLTSGSSWWAPPPQHYSLYSGSSVPHPTRRSIRHSTFSTTVLHSSVLFIRDVKNESWWPEYLKKSFWPSVGAGLEFISLDFSHFFLFWDIQQISGWWKSIMNSALRGGVLRRR